MPVQTATTQSDRDAPRRLALGASCSRNQTRFRPVGSSPLSASSCMATTAVLSFKEEHQMTRKIELPETAVAFRAEDGQQVVYQQVVYLGTDDPFRDGQVLLSPDGRLHYELDVQDFVGGMTSHVLAFGDPHRRHSGELRRDDDELTVDGVTYSKVPTPRQLTVVPLPEGPRRPEHLLRMPDGRLIYVSVDAASGDTSSLRVFVGYDDGQLMRQIRVVEAEWTVACWDIVIDDPADESVYGLLRIPHELDDPGLKPVLMNAAFDKPKPLDLSQFAITETPAGVTINPR